MMNLPNLTFMYADAIIRSPSMQFVVLLHSAAQLLFHPINPPQNLIFSLHTCSSELIATSLPIRMMTEMRDRGAIAFIGGPEDTCQSEALVSSAWNLPMISYVSPTFFAFLQTVVSPVLYPPANNADFATLSLRASDEGLPNEFQYYKIRAFSWLNVLFIPYHQTKLHNNTA